MKQISDNSIQIRDYIRKDIVIAHRGTTYWAPEETEPAYVWARNIGADYLELDLQISKDGRLIVFHDDDLKRITNVSEIFPDKADLPIIEFTLKELRSLDMGTWFNAKFPERAKETFNGLKILTFKDVIKVAEGFRIKMKNGLPVQELINGEWTGNFMYEKDPSDNGNRPGVYVETKAGELEKELAEELKSLGWLINNNEKKHAVSQDKVDVANTNARVILQSFSHESIKKLDKYLPEIPKCLLLWHDYKQKDVKKSLFEEIEFAIMHNVQIIGSSIGGEPNNYIELTQEWMTDLIHSSGMIIHPYTFDTLKQLKTYGSYIDGVFTNRANLALSYYGRLNFITKI